MNPIRFVGEFFVQEAFLGPGGESPFERHYLFWLLFCHLTSPPISTHSHTLYGDILIVCPFKPISRYLSRQAACVNITHSLPKGKPLFQNENFPSNA